VLTLAQTQHDLPRAQAIVTRFGGEVLPPGAPGVTHVLGAAPPAASEPGVEHFRVVEVRAGAGAGGG
jgi:hypothetical protein